MKKYYLLPGMFALATVVFAQRPIRDKHITHQQERMVFKQWDKNKFTPTSGFLGLNPDYWLTWGLHPDYKKKDLRPLGPKGPQTQRLALVVAMQNTANAYKLQSDTLRNTAISEAMNYSPLLSDADPLWLVYYRHEFESLIYPKEIDLLTDLPLKEKDYLLRSGVFDWYLEESNNLAERLNGARTTVLDRGSRILAYHRLLAEYRALRATWETKKQNARHFLALMDATDRGRNHSQALLNTGFRTDKQIAEDILRKSKL